MLRVTVQDHIIVLSYPRRQEDVKTAFFRRVLGLLSERTQEGRLGTLEGVYLAWHTTRSGVEEPRDHNNPTGEELRHLHYRLG